MKNKNSKRLIVDTCFLCGKPILEKEVYYTVQGKTFCKKCIENYSNKEE